MSYRAIYTYAWDLFEEGIPEAVGYFRGLGLDTVTVAGSYHAGKFLRPHGHHGKVYFPEDGTVYFKTNPIHYREIKPIQNSLLPERDVVGELCRQTRISTNVWLVLLHNTPLGMRHPDICVRNAFGDRYVYSLCPSNPEVRHYARAVCKDAGSYPVAGLSLESPGFAPYSHGYHHEFALNRPNRWLDNLLGLCFCDDCLGRADDHGFKDGKRLRKKIAADIRAYLSSEVNFPSDMAEAFWQADLATDGDLRAFLKARCNTVTSLIQEIKAELPALTTLAVIPSVARPTAGAWYEGTDLAAIAAAGHTIEACFYEPGADRVKADLFDIRRRIGETAGLRGIMRPAYPDFESKAEFLAAAQALIDGGVRDLAFYNWGHLRSANMAWIEDAMRMLKEG